MRHKLTYLGGMRALQTLGVFAKVAETDDPRSQNQEDGPQQHQNPAELLADIFQQADMPMNKQTPDNKTKPSEGPQLDKSVKWGPSIMGTGGELMERTVPGFNLPVISSI